MVCLFQEGLMKRSLRSSAKAPSTLPESVRQQLNAYALAASAVGVSLLALTQAANAKVVYTHTHKVINRGLPGILPLDLNHDGITDFSFSNWWQGGGTDFGPGGTLQIHQAQKANGIWGLHVGHGLCAPRFRPPRGSSSWAEGTVFFSPFRLDGRGSSDSQCAGPWTDVKNRYLGLKFIVKGKTHFGWARLNVACNPQNFKITAVLTGYAYETIPNKPIITGKTKGPDDGTVDQPAPATLRAPTPQPLSLGLLALGAQGVPLWRRKESVGGQAVSGRNRENSKSGQNVSTPSSPEMKSGGLSRSDTSGITETMA
jgi:hypothetical protein